MSEPLPARLQPSLLLEENIRSYMNAACVHGSKCSATGNLLSKNASLKYIRKLLHRPK